MKRSSLPPSLAVNPAPVPSVPTMVSWLWFWPADKLEVTPAVFHRRRAMLESAHIERCEGIFTAPVDQDLVLMSPTLDHYLAMDEVGRRVWELLESAQTFGELCGKLSREFEATPEQIAADVVPFLGRLTEKGLVRVVEE